MYLNCSRFEPWQDTSLCGFSFFFPPLISFTSLLLSAQTSHNSHDLIAMYPCIPALDGPLPLPSHTHGPETLSSHTVMIYHLLPGEPHHLPGRAGKKQRCTGASRSGWVIQPKHECNRPFYCSFSLRSRMDYRC